MDKLHINCDVGENDEVDAPFHIEKYIEHIDAVNIACGFHAGNPLEIQKIIDLCIEHRVEIGIHPSYRDRKNFGRVVLDQPLETLQVDVAYQIHAVKGMVEKAGGTVNHIKFHGALYNYSAQHSEVCHSLFQIISGIIPNVKVYGLRGTFHESDCMPYGLSFVAEGFADRKYETCNRLVPRGVHDALLIEPGSVIEQIDMLFRQHQVKCQDGHVDSLKVDTVCIHGDHPRIHEVLPLITKTFRS